MRINIYSYVLVVSSLLFWGCSSDSSSGVNSGSPSDSKTSTCTLANNYLPVSSILYSDDGRGGCIVSGQSFSNEEYVAYDAALLAMGFLKSEATMGSAIYTKVLNDTSVLTVNLNYVDGEEILYMTVTKHEKNYLFGDIEKMGDLYVKPLSSVLGGEIEWNYSESNSKNNLSSKPIIVAIDDVSLLGTTLTNKLIELGWTNVSYQGYITGIISYVNDSYSIEINWTCNDDWCKEKKIWINLQKL